MSESNQSVILPPVSLEAMNFDDLAPVSVPVSVKKEKYLLTEASAGAAIAYDNAKMKAMRMADGKLVGFEGMYDADLVLLSSCLHRVDKGTGQVVTLNGLPVPTPVQVIRNWPDRVYKPLVARLKEISPELQDKETEETLEKQLEIIQTKLTDLRRKKEAAKPQDDEEDDGPPRLKNTDGSDAGEVLSTSEERAKN